MSVWPYGFEALRDDSGRPLSLDSGGNFSVLGSGMPFETKRPPSGRLFWSRMAVSLSGKCVFRPRDPESPRALVSSAPPELKVHLETPKAPQVSNLRGL